MPVIKNQFQICSKTVMNTDSDPNICFDQNGISNIYWKFQNDIKPRWQTGPKGKATLEKQVSEIKKIGRGPQMITPDGRKKLGMD